MRKRITSRARTLPKELFLELNHDPSRTAIVLGSGRGGTTWLAESLARQHRSRLLFEPFHPRLGVLGEGLRLFPHAARDRAVELAVERVLSGRARTANMDQVLIARLPRARIIKDVHASNLLPWFRARYPSVPVVFTVRNPIAVSLSRLRSRVFYGLGDYLATPAGRRDAEASPVAAWLPSYDAAREREEPLVRLVAEWCIENVHPLACLDDEGVALVFYERAVLNPAAELARLGVLCQRALGSPRRALGDEEAREPSAMDWFGAAAEASRSGDWRAHLDRWTGEIPSQVLGECREVLDEFGLDGLYGDSPLPLSA